eukprot:Rhum_TRINITY_DN11736_c0_g1::Rhum_TRINITY_DN11736_c0_g1_i2::g.46598::m.46598
MQHRLADTAAANRDPAASPYRFGHNFDKEKNTALRAPRTTKRVSEGAKWARFKEGGGLPSDGFGGAVVSAVGPEEGWEKRVGAFLETARGIDGDEALLHIVQGCGVSAADLLRACVDAECPAPYELGEFYEPLANAPRLADYATAEDASRALVDVTAYSLNTCVLAIARELLKYTSLSIPSDAAGGGVGGDAASAAAAERTLALASAAFTLMVLLLPLSLMAYLGKFSEMRSPLDMPGSGGGGL